MSTPAANFNEREHVICQIARLVEERYIYWVGGGGEPLSAALLAKQVHAPNLQYLTEDGVVGPEPLVPFDPLMTMIAARANYRALQWQTMNYAADVAHLGYVDYGILATLQVDRYGNVNSTVVGKYEGGEGRRFGGPGGADTIAALAWRTILVTDQQKRKFVERNDFISSPGFLDGPGARERAGLPPGTGPWRVYTPWAMFGYDIDCQLMLQGISPFVTVDQVLEEMSFRPKIAPKLERLEVPTEEELMVLRTKIDVAGQVTDRGRWIEHRDGKYVFADR
ncbi:MAG TPA: CoA-transferase [Candidatus Binataceae bacterium]|nr:CoA-transferase [Candidatus Binataceae bacterium]